MELGGDTIASAKTLPIIDMASEAPTPATPATASGPVTMSSRADSLLRFLKRVISFLWAIVVLLLLAAGGGLVYLAHFVHVAMMVLISIIDLGALFFLHDKVSGMTDIIERLRRILTNQEPGSSRRELIHFLVSKLFDLALASTATVCFLIVAGIAFAGVLVMWAGFMAAGVVILAIAGCTFGVVLGVYCLIQGFLLRQVDRVLDVLILSGKSTKSGVSKRTDLTSTSAKSVVATERDVLVS